MHIVNYPIQGCFGLYGDISPMLYFVELFITIITVLGTDAISYTSKITYHISFYYSIDFLYKILQLTLKILSIIYYTRHYTGYLLIKHATYVTIPVGYMILNILSYSFIGCIFYITITFNFFITPYQFLRQTIPLSQSE